MLILQCRIPIEDAICYEILFIVQSSIAEELGYRWAHRSCSVPCFIEDCMMGLLGNSTIKVDVSDVCISFSVADEYALEIMLVLLGLSVTSVSYIDARSKQLEEFQVWSDSIACIIWSVFCDLVHLMIVEVYCVEDCC